MSRLRYTLADNQKNRESYIRTMPRCEDEREEQRKAARLSLDTSAHASLEYHKILQQCNSSPVTPPPSPFLPAVWPSTLADLLPLPAFCTTVDRTAPQVVYGGKAEPRFSCLLCSWKCSLFCRCQEKDGGGGQWTHSHPILSAQDCLNFSWLTALSGCSIGVSGGARQILCPPGYQCFPRMPPWGALPA